MKQINILRHTPELILILSLLGFFIIKKPYYEWDRVINSDGKGYYAYLPALFIYNDLEYKFVDEYEAKYYPGDRKVFKEFRYNYKGETVNKTFSGLAILWLPFFLIAHIFSMLSGFEADGYSLPYQYSIGLATIFYCWLGLKVLVSLLIKSGAEKKLANLIVLILAMGTNLLYYTFYEASMVHVYNFFLISTFLFFLSQIFNKYQRKWYVLSSLFFALIIATRPQNGFIILMFPFFASSRQHFILFFRNFFREYSTILFTVLIFCIIIAIPITLWYLQTGYFLVYSYGTERFDFSDPHFFGLLFSYNKGWFVYSPLALLSFTGLIPLFKINKFKFFAVTSLFIVVIYVFSSWWVWNYCSRFGQRVFIDYYAVIALMLLYAYKLFNRTKVFKATFRIIILLLITLNIIQFYQHYKYIFPGGDISKELYWNSFFRLKPTAKFPVSENAVSNIKTYFNDMENDMGWTNSHTITNHKAFSGKKSEKVRIRKVKPFCTI